MKRRIPVTRLALAVLLALCSAAKAGGPLDDRVPKDAIAYFGWAGSDALQAQYAGSNLKAFVDASSAQKWIAEQLPKWIDMAAKQDPTAPQVIAKLQTGLGIAWHHPVAVYFCPVGLANPQQPEFRFGLLCDAGNDAGTLAGLLKEAVASTPPQPTLPINVTVDGTLVGLVFGKPQTAAERQVDGGLKAVPTYVKSMGHFTMAQPAFASYVDFAQGMAMANVALTRAPDIKPEDRAKVATVLEMTGLNQLTQMAGVQGFDGKEWSGQSLLGVNGKPKGVLALLGGAPLSDTALLAVPKEAVSFSTAKLDLHQAFGEARQVVGAVDANVLKQFDAAVAQASAQVGFDVDGDFLGALGDEWVLYRAPLSDLGGNSYALVHKLRDGDRFAKTLATLEALANKAGAGQFKIDKMTESKIEFSTVSYLQYSVAWTVRNGYLYVSSMDGIVGAVKQVENKLPDITQSPLYQKALAQVGATGGKPTAIAYSNPAKLYPEIRRALVGLMPLLRPTGIDIPMSVLPEPEEVAAVLTPGADVSWWDAEGLHQASHAAFPGAAMMGGSGGGTSTVAVAALGTAILLPSLGKARELSNRTVDAASLRGISQSCVVTAAGNNDKMPDDLAQLVADGSISPKQLVSRRSGTAPLEMTPEMQLLAKSDFAKFSAQLAAHTDFVYLGKGTTSDMDASVVVAYEKPGPHVVDGMNVAFGDGHVEFVRLAALTDVFGPTNEARKKKGLALVDVQAILTQCGVAAVPQPAPVRTVPDLP